MFRIQRKNGSTIDSVIYLDDSGNAHFAGSLDAADGTFAGTLSADCITSGTLSADRIGANTITSSKLADAVNRSISTAQSTANSANGSTQLIYISKASGTDSVNVPADFVMDASGGQNIWTLKRPVYDSNYPIVFVATQRRAVGGAVTCTTPMKDDTTTVIDGGHITTGTIDAAW